MIEFIFYVLLTIFCILLVKCPWLILGLAGALVAYGAYCSIKSIWETRK